MTDPSRFRITAVGLLAVSLSACVQPPPRRVMTRPVSAPAATAPAIYFYPGQGQTVERQERDRFACYQWARSQTGIDPGMTPVRGTTTTIVEPRVTGAGAAVGAVTGAAVGAATSGRHGGGGAVVLGAIIGSVFGAATESAHANARAQAQARDDDARALAAAQRQVDDFRRAMGACMSSRGYTIG